MNSDKTASENITSFCLRIPTELKIQFDILSKKEKRSTNRQIEIALEKYMEDNKHKLSS